jgi:hypothetical protein
MKKIDKKSLLVGMILGVCVLLALGAATGRQADIGRYQVVACPDNQSTCFVIDTTTGQVWRRFGESNGQNYGSPKQWK